MDDLISRQAAIETADFECGEWRGLAGTIINGLKNLPAVDAVPVVRCRDCAHNELPPTAGNALCSIYDGMTEVYGFCHNGERREE